MENNLLHGTHFSEYEAKIKLYVLSNSLRIENIISDFLGEILTLNRLSKSLGNTSQALSMNQKVNLMLDTSYFQASDKINIQHFQGIRNQFMHNIAAISLESCFSFLNGAEKSIEKQYLEHKLAAEKAGGEKLAQSKEDEEINNKELESFDVTNKEKLLFNYLIFLMGKVIESFEKSLQKLVNLKFK